MYEAEDAPAPGPAPAPAPAPAPTSTTATDLDPAVLLLAAEIAAMLRTPPLPPRSTLERVRSMLSEHRRLAQEQAGSPPAAADPDAHRAQSRPKTRAESIQALQAQLEQPALSIGSRLAAGHPPGPQTLKEYAALSAKRGGFAVEVDAARDFRF